MFSLIIFITGWKTADLFRGTYNPFIFKAESNFKNIYIKAIQLFYLKCFINVFIRGIIQKFEDKV